MSAPRRREPPPMGPVLYGKATRENILAASMTPAYTPYNKYVRGALGFREKNPLTKGKPVFVSAKVTQLYNLIDHLACNKLPNHSHDALHEAWVTGKYTKDVERLFNEHGEGIWGDPIEARLPSNADSQLVTSTEDRSFGDLFYEYERHRQFIVLQLEHLAFIKAKAYCCNHYPEPQKSDVAKQKVSTPATSRKAAIVPRKPSVTVSSSGEKYLVVIRVAPKKLKHALAGPSASSNDRKRGASGKCLPEDIVDSVSSHDECDNENDSAGSDEEDWVPRKSRRISRRALVYSNDDTEETLVNAESEASDEGGRQNPVVGDHEATAAEDALSEEELEMMRLELPALLYGEICLEDEASNAKLPNSASMLSNSQELDRILEVLWLHYEDSCREALGESFERARVLMDAWLSWRKGCWVLCEATSVHPFASLSAPEYTLPQWEELLGGGQRFRIVHRMLLDCRKEKLASKIQGSDDIALNTAEHLGRIFAALADDKALERLTEDIIAYNKRLFSWKLDVW